MTDSINLVRTATLTTEVNELTASKLVDMLCTVPGDAVLSVRYMPKNSYLAVGGYVEVTATWDEEAPAVLEAEVTVGEFTLLDPADAPRRIYCTCDADAIRQCHTPPHIFS